MSSSRKRKRRTKAARAHIGKKPGSRASRAAERTPPERQGAGHRALQMAETMNAAGLVHARSRFVGSAAGGSVRVMVNGNLQVVSIVSVAEDFEESGHPSLNDAIVEAANDALAQARRAGLETMAGLTGSLGRALPPPFNF